MKLSCYWLMVIVYVFGASALADTKRVISVKGYAAKSIPIDLVLLTINASIKGEAPEIVEKQGYQMGINLKNVFKKYGISEKNITNSSISFNKEALDRYREEKKKEPDSFVFHLKYSVLFDKFKWIDDFRKDCIEIGVIKFELSEIYNKDRVKHENQLLKMAFNNAKKKAESIIQESRFKLGMPVSINMGYSKDYSDDDTASSGLGPVDPSQPKREALFKQKEFYITQQVSVDFSIEN